MFVPPDLSPADASDMHLSEACSTLEEMALRLVCRNAISTNIVGIGCYKTPNELLSDLSARTTVQVRELMPVLRSRVETHCNSLMLPDNETIISALSLIRSRLAAVKFRASEQSSGWALE